MSIATEVRRQGVRLGQRLMELLARPRPRLTVVGALLVILGACVISASAWTVPIVSLGAAMICIAYFSARLEGRLALEWGPQGTEIHFRARVRSRPVDQLSPAVAAPEVPSTPELETIDSTAHTVEIDAHELKALIAAVDAVKAAESADSAEAVKAADAGVRAPTPELSRQPPHQ